MHLTIMNAAFAQKQMLKDFYLQGFIGEEIINKHFNDLKFAPEACSKIEISTRFDYEEEEGYYLPEYVMNI